MANFRDNIFDFYKFVTPGDLIGGYAIDGKIGPSPQQEPGKTLANTNIDAQVAQDLKTQLLEVLKSGLTFTNEEARSVNPKNISLKEKKMQFAMKGLYNVVYVTSTSPPTTQALFQSYFTAISSSKEVVPDKKAIDSTNKEIKKLDQDFKKKQAAYDAAEKNATKQKEAIAKKKYNDEKKDTTATSASAQNAGIAENPIPTFSPTRQKELDKIDADLKKSRDARDAAQKKLDAEKEKLNKLTNPEQPKLVPMNYCEQVCDTKDPPPVPFSVILLRAPMLSKANDNTHVIQLYLTAMPPVMANRLMPYCDVEFQLPLLNLARGESDANTQKSFIQRPSLYRFLVGSGEDYSNYTFTDANRSIANIVKESRRDAKARVEGKGSGTTTPLLNQTFFGMEMFTTPQTLFDYDSLRSNMTDGQPKRLNSAKPFLPPATIKDVTITVQNAGSRCYGKRNATIKMTIHDKKRLVEMGEFLRGSDGYARAIVWITYGMLAPRGLGAEDVYAQFINSNMLVRDAFSISNVQFNFNADQSVEVTITCGQKGTKRIESSTITFSEIDALKSELNKLATYFKEEAAAFGDIRDENSGFTKSEVRMAQLISSAGSGNFSISDDDIKAIKKEQDDLKKLLDAKVNGRGENFDAAKAKELVDKYVSAVEKYRGVKKDASAKIKQKLDKIGESDPFFPTSAKNDHVIMQKLLPKSPQINELYTKTLQDNNGSIKIFDENLVKQCDASKHVSLGKIFSLLAIEPFLYCIADEFNVSSVAASQKDKPEVQFVFYQLNNHCGPVSNHNIAEFPIDKALFIDRFASLVESTGGEAITMEQFFEFLNELVSDPRQPGYGRVDFYKPFVAATDKDKAQGEKPEPKEAQNKKGENKTTETLYADNLKAWSEKYGDEFVMPDLAFELESGLENTDKLSISRSGDLLNELGNRIAAGYTQPVYPTDAKKKTIVRLHIYDKSSSPHDRATKALRLAPNGTYYLVQNQNSNEENVLNEIEKASRGTTDRARQFGDKVMINGQLIAVDIGQGKEALMEYVGAQVPRILIGTEGTLITQANLQSKTSGLEGTIALQGGSQKREFSLASSGLSQNQFNTPMILYPAELTLNTLGCPLAAMGQNFFIDFDTNTTLDNVYVVKSVSHAFSPGKFDTSWSLSYYDGYGRMISDNETTGILGAIAKAKKEADEKKAADEKAEQDKRAKENARRGGRRGGAPAKPKPNPSGNGTPTPT